MTGVHNSLTWTRSDDIAEVLSAESCHIVLETSHPDNVEKISQYIESSVDDNVCDETAEAESDSEDSLFLTQKSVPEAVRPARQLYYSLRSKPISPRDLEESAEDNSSSASYDEESKSDNKRRRKKYTLPKFSFPFLTEQKCKLLPSQNKCLHTYLIGGFFESVRVGGPRQGEDPESSLPTVDLDGESISPLSEEDEERAEEEDIKVVERKRFVVSSKAKSQQTWCNPLKQQRTGKASIAKQDASQGRQANMLHKIAVKASTLEITTMSSDTEISVNGESSCRVLERNDEQATSDGNFLAQTETPKTKRRSSRGDKKVIFLQKASKDELRNDNDATVGEPRRLQGSTPNNREASTTVTEPQTDISHSDDPVQTNQAGDELQKRTKRKRKKKKKGEEVVETPSPSTDNRAAQTSGELEFNEENRMEILSRDENVLSREKRDIPDSRKKNKSEAFVAQEMDGSLEADLRVGDSLMSVSCNVEKKKKSGEDVEQLQFGAVDKLPNNDAEIQKKKKKKKKKQEGIVITEECEKEKASNWALDLPPMLTEQLEESGNCLENTAASQETLESSYVKRKKHKKRQKLSSQDGEECVDVNFCIDDTVTTAKGSGMSLKKKKKTIFEEENISCTHEGNENVGNTQKTKEGVEDQIAEVTKTKKKKKKMSEIISRNVSEDKVARSDDSVSVREKEKKRTSSFLDADAEENDAQALREICVSPESHVWWAEKPSVSAGDLVELNENRVTKKRKKRKMSVVQDSVEKDGKQDFEEPNARVKRKKKRKGNESESVTPTETLERAADVELSPTVEAVVLKKKKKKKKCKDEPSHVMQEDPPSATKDKVNTE